jgi:hypothetical protein
MQPARVDLPVTPGTTYRDTARLMQPDFAYRDIVSVQGAPAIVSVPAHGLVSDWPVWVQGVAGLQAINVDPIRQRPWRAKLLDAGRLEINVISATGRPGTGGQLIYKLPVDLTGCTVSMRFYRTGSLVLELSLGGGLAITSLGTITRELTPAQTALLDGGVTYVMDVTSPDAAVIRYYDGALT